MGTEEKLAQHLARIADFAEPAQQVGRRAEWDLERRLVSNDAKHMGGSPPAAQLRQQATLSRTRMSGDEGGGRSVVGVRFRTDGIQESQLDPASDEARAHAES